MDYTKKTAAEVIACTWDFTNKMGTGETLSAVSGFTVTDQTGTVSADAAVGAGTISGDTVTASVSGGVAGNLYVLACEVTTSLGQTLVDEGFVMVIP